MPLDAMVRAATFAALALFTTSYVAVWARSLWPVRKLRPTAASLLTGLVTNFFDTLGIGSFATTTSIFKFAHMVPDQLIPGTLNVGHTIPTIFQAFIYIAAIEVEAATLVLMIAGAVAGSWFGSGWVAQMPTRKVQIGVGCALLFAFVVLLMRQFDLFPAGGQALGLTGGKLIVAVTLNCLFGAISTLGIGFYAPCMTLVGLLGMNPIAAFPIMMGSSAFWSYASGQFPVHPPRRLLANGRHRTNDRWSVWGPDCGLLGEVHAAHGGALARHVCGSLHRGPDAAFGIY